MGLVIISETSQNSEEKMKQSQGTVGFIKELCSFPALSYDWNTAVSQFTQSTV